MLKEKLAIINVSHDQLGLGLAQHRNDILFSSLLVTVLSLALPLALLQIYDRIIPNQGYSTLYLLSLIVLLAIVFETTLRIIRSYFMTKMGARFEYAANLRGFQQLWSRNIAQVENVSKAEHIERFNSINLLREFYSGQPFVLLLDVSFAALYVVLIAYLGGLLVLIPIAIVAFSIFNIISQYGMLLRHAAWQTQLDNRYYNFVISCLNALVTIKQQASYTILRRHFEHIQRQRGKNMFQNSRAIAWLQDLNIFLSQYGLVILVVMGALSVNMGYLTMGQLAACTILFGRVMQPVQSLLQFMARLQVIVSSQKKIQ